MLSKLQQNNMIQIEETKIVEAAEKGMDDFLKIFTDAYLEALGGFVQLIQYGYGGYVLDNPTAKSLKQIGAKGFSKILYKAKDIYEKHRAELERETTEEEFMAMYEQFEQFDELEEKFFYIEEEETLIVAQYVDDNIEDFAEIIK